MHEEKHASSNEEDNFDFSNHDLDEDMEELADDE